MGVTDSQDDERVKRTFVENLQHWLFSQGTSTVLLFFICYGIWYGATTLIPMQVKTIQEGYKENAAMLDKSAERYERAVEKLTTSVDDLKVRIDRVLDERRVP